MSIDISRWKWPLTAALALAMILGTWRLTRSATSSADSAPPASESLLALSQPPGGFDPTATPTPDAATPTPTDATPATIAVYVSGAVRKPGVYRLPAGARADDALRAADGPAAEADTARVNLAARLRDEEQIYIPKVGELNPPVPTGGGQPGPTNGSPAGDGKVNINQASAAELDTLPRIGPATAQRIIDYRTANGPFAAIEDLQNVKGIGAATFGDLKDRITVGP